MSDKIRDHATIAGLSSVMLFPNETSDWERNRWAYSTAAKFDYFYRKARDAQERYLSAKNEGRFVIPKSEEGSSTIQLQPYSTIESGFTELLIPTDELMSIFAPAPMVIHAEADNASLKGQLAGALLVYLYHLKKYRMELPNLPNARKVCNKRAMEIHPRKNSRPKKGSSRILCGLSDDFIENTWREYRSVAHWWAAYVSLDQIALQPTRFPLSSENVEEMTQRAKVFAKFGSRDFTQKSNKSIPLKTNDLVWPDGMQWRDGIDIDDTKYLSDEIQVYIKKALGY